MSNRTIEQSDKLAELKLSHELQIEALTAPGLSDEERVKRFGEAAGFDAYERRTARSLLDCRMSSARALWLFARPERSLFASLPDCECPVAEVIYGRAKYPGIPTRIPHNWRPTRSVLEAFARVQQEERS